MKFTATAFPAVFLVVLAACQSPKQIQALPSPRAQPAIAKGTFEWRLVNNFRPFERDANRIRLFANAESRGTPPREAYENYLRIALATLYLDEESQYSITSTKDARGHFDVIQNRYSFFEGNSDYTPAKFALAEVMGNVEGECTWVVTDFGARLTNQETSTCSQNYFSVGEQGIKVEVTPANGVTEVIDISYDEKVIVALGDSYVSGEGTPPFLDRQCSLSLYSWPYLVTALLANENPKTVYTIINRACTGARIEHLTHKPYEGLGPSTRSKYGTVFNSAGVGSFGSELDVGPKEKMPQIEQAKADLCNVAIESIDTCAKRPDLIFLGIGGNDAEFGKNVRDVIGKKAVKGKLASKFDEYKTVIENGYADLENKLDKHFPETKIYTTNYVNPLRKYNGEICSDDDARTYAGLAIRRFAWLFGVGLSDDEMSILESEFIDPLLGEQGIGGILKDLEERDKDRWVFVKTYHSLLNGQLVDPEYATRGLCDGVLQVPYDNDTGVTERGAKNSWFNSYEEAAEVTNASGIVHPNIFGQMYYARKVLEALCDNDEICVTGIK